MITGHHGHAVTHAYGGNSGGVFRLHRGLTRAGREASLLPLGWTGEAAEGPKCKEIAYFSLLLSQLVGGDMGGITQRAYGSRKM